MSDVHPIYAETKPGRQWSGLVQALWSQLNREVENGPRGTWCWRIIPNGMVVALQRIPKVDVARYEFRVARRGHAGDHENDDEWAQDLRAVLKSMVITVIDGDTPALVPLFYWTKVEEIDSEELHVLKIRSLLQGEIQPGKAYCYPCTEDGTTTVVEWFPQGGVRGQRCQHHAMKRR